MHTRCMLDKQGYTHMHALTRPAIRTHASTRARAYVQNMQYFLLIHGNNDSRMRLDFTLYIHCLSSSIYGD
jgi:hypothetical protein